MKTSNALIKYLAIIICILLMLLACSNDSAVYDRNDLDEEIPLGPVQLPFETVQVTYKTLALDSEAIAHKIVLEFDELIDASSVDVSEFSLHVVHMYADETENIQALKIATAYLSNPVGMPSYDGRHIAIEALGPKVNQEDTSDIYYIVQIKNDAGLQFVDGRLIRFIATGKRNFSGYIPLE
ncbi:hypothetical protein EZV73_11570 [Acidaminobacter sp. JC074]|uniref:hypothetical protein n=1 Tax=Acidaminobacter sp. JC074 TaxID=2530199 RepID=UPI001F1115A8|nr:hypothetical protein [Acidaminobacter sp. JC074]MCH4888217.1 hypothetical protein [Acidaminobacter sp. JC074]